MTTTPTTTIAATFCATLVDEWVRAGVRSAFAAPGSRSTPLALALAADTRIQLHVFHDERAASFAGLGHALATANPTVITATSGTAAAHFHAAVIEADLSCVPLIVCTTDRPPELWQVGAPQTVDQTKLYGSTVRFFSEPGVPTDDTRSAWRSIGSRLVAEARGASGLAGPVHCNLSFRDPLVGSAGTLPAGRPTGAPWHLDLRLGADNPADAKQVEQVWHQVRGLEGIVIAGAGTSDPTAVLTLARRLGWPILADHRSGCRAEEQAIVHADALLRHQSFADNAEVDVVLRFGAPLASKALSQWLARKQSDAASAPQMIVAHGNNRWSDPERLASHIVSEQGLAKGLLAQIPSDYDPAEGERHWRLADELAQNAVAEVLAAQRTTTEIGVARHLVEYLASGAALVVSSSMPIRDVEWFAPNRRNISVYANRGANGIDGVISTAVGVALGGGPTTLLIGDVAFLHDSSALIALARRRLDLTIVVVDNDGGGIFSFLPQAQQLPADTFETLFGTSHGTDIVALCQAHGIPAMSWEPGDPTPGAVGVRVLVAKTNREENARLHDKINSAVANAIA